MKAISEEKLDTYFLMTDKALAMAREAPKDQARIKEANDLLDMAQRYRDDAHHFRTTNDWVNAFAAICYAHAFLDAAARQGLIVVNDSHLFMVD